MIFEKERERKATFHTTLYFLGAVDICRAGCVAARVEEVDANIRLGIDGLDLSGGVGGQRHPTVLLAGEVELFAAGREALLAFAAACLETGHIDICRLNSWLDDGRGLGLGSLGSLCCLSLVGGILPLGRFDCGVRNIFEQIKKVRTVT